MLSVLIIFLFIVFIVQFIISFSFVFRLFLQYRDGASIQLIITFLCLNLSIFFAIFWVNINSSNLSFYSSFYRFSMITLFLTAINICMILDKKFYDFKTRLASKFSYTFYTICLGLVISDAVTNRSNFFYLLQNNNVTFPYYSPVASVFLIVSNIFLLFTFYLSYRSLKVLPTMLVAHKSFFVIFASLIIILAVFSFDFLLQMTNIALVGIFAIFINLSYFIILNFISIIFTYFSFTQIFLHFSGNPNPNILIKKGFIGYYLASVTENGPEPINYSKTFVEYSKLPAESILGLAYSSISIVGMFSGIENISYSSKVSLIPVPGIENYSSLVYTFFTKNDRAIDERLKIHEPTAYCILFPSNFSLDLSKLTSTIAEVSKILEKNDQLDYINNNEILSSITNGILRKLLV